MIVSMCSTYVLEVLSCRRDRHNRESVDHEYKPDKSAQSQGVLVSGLLYSPVSSMLDMPRARRLR